jgi:hypothetical protein
MKTTLPTERRKCSGDIWISTREKVFVNAGVGTGSSLTRAAGRGVATTAAPQPP